MSELGKEILRALLQSQLAIEKARLYGASRKAGSKTEIAIVCANEGTEAAIENIQKQIKEL